MSPAHKRRTRPTKVEVNYCCDTKATLITIYRRHPPLCVVACLILERVSLRKRAAVFSWIVYVVLGFILIGESVCSIISKVWK